MRTVYLKNLNRHVCDTPYQSISDRLRTVHVVQLDKVVQSVLEDDPEIDHDLINQAYFCCRSSFDDFDFIKCPILNMKAYFYKVLWNCSKKRFNDSIKRHPDVIY